VCSSDLSQKERGVPFAFSTRAGSGYQNLENWIRISASFVKEYGKMLEN